MLCGKNNFYVENEYENVLFLFKSHDGYSPVFFFNVVKSLI